ncbi:PLP-dependent aminotransferase family protein [Echinicola vietnamensis]|uniref:Transcriptional regulator with HTH domain and aminotransferase domain n=1 Tax=Echinicola vietnamensis (strain DSM 17526 / LMG 23754 / KMM 6221) TaxID=926556 RepID=L0FX82_ECHVK|nr:PLP-dependent aminotransferase family protein [Echinicola vietnamensis]AGA77643.1 transcriptional regulator with HTH domain and aminotransferase domain [Echinicola vietnamensis DSM 17526]
MVPKLFHQLRLHDHEKYSLQIEEFIKRQIQKGILKEDFPMPSGRELAIFLSVHRKTVMKAYERLTAQGYLYVVERVGFYVGSKNSGPGHFEKLARTVSLSEDFPDISLSPVRDLAQSYRRYFWKGRKHDKHLIQSQGYPPFENTLHHYLVQERGISCTREEFYFSHGHYTLLFLIIYSLFPNGGTIVLEEPGDPRALEILRQAGVKCFFVKVDGKGMKTEHLEQLCSQRRVDAVLISSRCQYPTTAFLSHDRRKTLTSLSYKEGFYILECDYDHEFIYSREVPIPLRAEYPSGKLIYMTSLSKMMPSLYLMDILVAPKPVISKVRSILQNQRNVILEQSVNELLKTGVIRLYAEKLKRRYRKRRDELHGILSAKEGIYYHLPESGLAFWLEFSRFLDLEKLLGSISTKGFFLQNPSVFYASGYPGNTLRLGFGKMNREHLKEFLELM